MSVPDADEDFEFLVNLLASDGVDSDPPPAGLHQADPDLKIQSGSDGKLDLGRVKAYYENKHMGVGVRDDGPGLADHQPPTNRSVKGENVVGLALEGDISVSRSVSDRDDQTGSLSREPLTTASHGTGRTSTAQAQASTLPLSAENPGKWIDALSEREAKQLLVEISDALRLKLPLDDDQSPAPDRLGSLNEVQNVVEFVVKMDELVWRRSEHGANRGVFDAKNIRAVEERIRLWEGIARSYSSG